MFPKRYTGFDIANHAVRVIETHAATRPTAPMFMYFAPANTHAPIQAPDEFIALYNFSLEKQNIFNAMVSVVDLAVKDVVDALVRTGMWDNTLFVWTTDNGSPIQEAGSNAPMMGGKGVDWEGGIRVPAFVTGGFLPARMGGKSLDGIIAGWDYFATFCRLAGVDPAEPHPNSPTPVYSYDLWPYLSGEVDESPRQEIVFDQLQYDENTTACIFPTGYVQVMPCNGAGAMRVGDFKLLVGQHGRASHYGHFSPNASWSEDMLGAVMCSVQKPCLFNIRDDMAEEHDLSQELPEVVDMLLKRYHSYDSEYHPPQDLLPNEDDLQCKMALQNGGFRMPWYFPMI